MLQRFWAHFERRSLTGLGPRLWLWVVPVIALGLLSGCTILPSQRGRVDSVHLPQSQETRLGRIAATAIQNRENSGFHFLPVAFASLMTRIELAEEAQATLDVQYYVLAKDRSGLNLLRALRDAAKRGVRVRILLDDLYLAGEDELLDGLAAYPNVQIRLFNPFPNGRSSFSLRLLSSLDEFSRVDRRMHNKLFVADNAMAVAGGRNIADEYFMLGESRNFIDMDVIAVGRVVDQMSDAFDLYWDSHYVYPFESIVPPKGTSAERQERFDAAVADVAEVVLDPSYAERLRPYVMTPDELRHDHLSVTEAKAELLVDPVEKAGGAFESDRTGTVRARIGARIRAAESDILISTPYLIPGQVGIDAARELHARGVRARVLTNSLAATDEPLVHSGYLRYRVPLLREGVELYEMSPVLAQRSQRLGRPGTLFGSLHAKATVIDKRWLFLGSMNLDRRSERKNTEIGILIDSPKLTGEFLRIVDFVESAYQVRLAPNGEDLQWVIHRGGQEEVLMSEPEASDFLRWEVKLLAPFVSEDEL